MSSANKKFRYGNGDTEESDAFITSVVANAPKRKDEPVVDRPHCEMVDLHNARMHYAEDKGMSIFNTEKRFENSCARLFVFGFCGILLLAGLGVIIFAAVEKHEQVLPVCPECSSFIIAMFVFGAVLFVVALWGIGAAKTRVKCLAYPFAGFVVLIAVVFVAAGIAAVVYETNAKDLDLEKLWKDAVKNDKNFICRIQKDFHCSGFGANHCCKSHDASLLRVSRLFEALEAPPRLLAGDSTQTPSGLGYCYTNATTEAWVTEVCVIDPAYPVCTTSNNMYQEPCDSKLEDAIKAHFIPVIVTLFATAFLLALTAVSAVRMTFVRSTYM